MKGVPVDMVDVAGRNHQSECEYDHEDDDVVRDPHRIFTGLRDRCPVAWNDRHDGFWLVTGYSECEAAAKDPATFSSRFITVPKKLFGELTLDLPPVTVDPPRHGLIRQLMAPAFAPGKVAGFEPSVRQACGRFIDEFIQEGACDASHQYARRVPITAIAVLLGLPSEDEDLLSHWVDRAIVNFDPEDAPLAGAEMGEYLVALMDDHAQHPRDDLLTHLLEAEVDGERLDEDDVLGSTLVLVLAGIDTTWRVLGHALWHLARHPDDRARLRAEPSLMPTAVEEFLRYYAPASMGRVVNHDTVLSGTALAKDDSMLLCFPSANRDAKAFPDADRFIIDRVENRHFGFGVGIHSCIGARFARLELKVGIQTWLERIPDFRIADEDAVRWTTGQVWGPRVLPLTWS